MGAYGSWEIAAARPDRFAAIAPIVGAGNPQASDLFKDLPVSDFHGALDQTVPLLDAKKLD